MQRHRHAAHCRCWKPGWDGQARCSPWTKEPGRFDISQVAWRRPHSRRRCSAGDLEENTARPGRLCIQYVWRRQPDIAADPPAALRVDEDLCANANARGQQLQQGLRDLADRCDLVRGVRGRGLMLGLEFQPMPDTMVTHFKGMDASGTTALLVPNLDDLIHSIPGLYAMQILLQEHGIYTQVTRSNPRVLRIQPPLTITEEQVVRFLAALESTCHELQFLNQTVDSIIRKSIAVLVLICSPSAETLGLAGAVLAPLSTGTPGERGGG